MVSNIISSCQLGKEGHDYGFSKRKAMYAYLAKHFDLNLKKSQNAKDEIDESGSTIENENALKVFGDHGEKLPANAVKGFDKVTKVFESAIQ